METPYFVVIRDTPRATRDGLAVPGRVVGPFKRHDLAYDWAEYYLHAVGWEIISGASRDDAARVYRRGWRGRKAVL